MPGRMPRTIRAKIALWTGILSLLIVLIIGIFLYTSLRIQLFRYINENLTNRAQLFLDGIGNQNGLIRFDNEALSSMNFPDNISARLVSHQGVVLDRFGDEYIPILSPPQSLQSEFHTRRFFDEEDPDARDLETFQFLIIPIDKDGNVIAYLQVGQDIESIRETLSKLMQLLFLTCPILVVTATLGGYWLAGRALAPIEVIRLQADSIQAEGLHRRVKTQISEDEVGRLAQTINAMLDRLEESFIRQRQFTADASHELRTPLAIIRGEIDVALNRARSQEEYICILNSIGVEEHRMSRMVNELLFLARSDSGEIQLVIEEVDLSDLIGLLVDQMQNRAQEAGITLTAYIPNNLSIMGDKDRLVELFLNLIENALRYAPESNVHIYAINNIEETTLIVKDTGPGIAEEHLPHIFQRFYQVDQVRGRSSNGNGLGLAIALEIARAHKGDITVESILGEGTEFRVKLPKVNKEG